MLGSMAGKLGKSSKVKEGASNEPRSHRKSRRRNLLRSSCSYMDPSLLLEVGVLEIFEEVSILGKMYVMLERCL